MKAGRIFILLAVFSLYFFGCEAPVPVAGEITFGGPGIGPMEPVVGALAPEIYFESIDGESMSLSAVREPIAILVFKSGHAESCCELTPKLKEIAERIKFEPITIAQLSEPTMECGFGAGCAECGRISDVYLIALCDDGRIAWQAYGEPGVDAVYLIGPDGKIRAKESYGDLERIVMKARRLAREYYREQDTLYQGPEDY
jgi:hypothetical protein